MHANLESPITGAYLEHGDAIRRFIARLTHGDEIEDIAQEAFLRAYSVELLRPIEMPKSFLFRIAKHLALTRLDRCKRWQYEELDDEFSDSTPEDHLIAEETITGHFEAIDSLSESCRRVYWLRKFEDLSHKELAARFGIAVSTVEKHLMKASQRVGL